MPLMRARSNRARSTPRAESRNFRMPVREVIPDPADQTKLPRL